MTAPLTHVTFDTESQIMTTDSIALPDYLVTALNVYEEPAALASNSQPAVLQCRIMHSLNELNERVLYAGELLKFGEDELANSTDEDKTRAALVALTDMNIRDSRLLFNLAGRVAQLIKIQVIADAQRSPEKANPAPQTVNRPSLATQPSSEKKTLQSTAFCPANLTWNSPMG